MPGLHRKSHNLLLQLAALALLLNALIPAGFMLHPSGAAGMTVVLCPSQGPMPGFPDDEHHRSVLEQATAADARAGDEGTCVFAAATGPMLSASVVTLVSPEFLSSISSTQSLPFIRPPSRSTLTVRGPPAIS